ncbi:hypothetical protein POM88_020295 [Heracleum sosnowskyi]|uniref:Shugoshin C-terminal domain-containing protein n=1 Tax=Heracleum sosnowskyi TaxID=360622 RepID=A0AAD8MMY9_9APIA|nr:hypothetical protein POM88_020295 [Heracleum sosnowskyi]
MLKREGLFVLNSDNNFTPSDQNEHKVRRSAMVSRNMERKGLRIITNLPQQFKTLVTDEKSKLKAASTEECINKLIKENTSLLNLLADKDKIIESSGLELQKLKAELHQIKEKNVDLAQSNTQMLAELNSRKYRLKLLQHELGCKQGLLIAKKVESEVEMPKCKKTSKFSGAAKYDYRPCKINRKQPSKSLASFVVKQLEDNKNVKRLFVGSQSANYESEETKNVEDLLEVDSLSLPSHLPNDDEIQEHDITSNLMDKEDENSDKKSLLLIRYNPDALAHGLMDGTAVELDLDGGCPNLVI